MEYMLTEALSIYSGGLGNVAGDQLKAASDLGVPVVGVGLLYQQGYFRQVIDQQGAQQALYPYNDPGQMPITPVREPNGEWLRLRLDLPGTPVWVRAWQVQVGRVRLYLLDSNDPANLPPQRLLRALGLQPDVCHLDKGHAAFAVLERAASFMQDTHQPFEVAWTVTRAGNLFTTHTAVAAGFDLFPPALVEHYLGPYAQQQLGLSVAELLALGRRDGRDDREPSNMAYLAMRGSGAVNRVSRLHRSVSQHVFAPLFPRWPRDEVPVGYVTDGVHMPSWDSADADDLWTETSGKSRWLGALAGLEQDIRGVPDARLWRMRNTARAADRCALGKRLVAWRQAVEQQCDQIGFGRLDVEAGGGQLTCGVEVLLHGIQPGAVRVELYADAIDSADPVRQEMTPVGPSPARPAVTSTRRHSRPPARRPTSPRASTPITPTRGSRSS
jgi:starch phosphorylase